MRASGPVTVAVLLALTTRAAADPSTYVPCPDDTCYLHIVSNSSLYTDTSDDVQLRLPPGWFVDEGTWGRMDAEQKRLQDVETRLSAENRTLRTALDGWQPGWMTLSTALVVGLAAGIYIGVKL